MQKAIKGKNEGSKVLVRVTKNLNNAYNRVIKMTPAEAVRERKDEKTVGETNELLKDAAYGANRRRKPFGGKVLFTKGQKVYLLVSRGAGQLKAAGKNWDTSQYYY